MLSNTNPHVLRIETNLDPLELRELCRKYEPWGHRIDFSNGFSTLECSKRVPFSENTLEKFNSILKYIPSEKLFDMRMLDVGCNSGYNSIHAAQKFGMKVTGIDVTKRHIEVATLLADISHVDVEFSLASAEEFLRKDTYDLICHFGTLYHLPNPLRSLELMYKNLKRKGYLAIETQIYEHPDDDNICYFMHMQNNDPTNFWALSLKVLIDYLNLVGFKEVRLLKRTTPALMSKFMHRVLLLAEKK